MQHPMAQCYIGGYVSAEATAWHISNVLTGFRYRGLSLLRSLLVSWSDVARACRARNDMLCH
jgi:hypothetical protein